jgi:hypothetical protein
MMPWLALLGVAVLLYVSWRQNELFSISVRRGRVLLVRGRIPGTLLGEFRTIARGIERGSIRAAKTQHGARLTASGFDDGRLQRLRNTLSLYPIAQLRAAKPVANPTWGQVLGIASLAWWLDGLRDRS